MFLLTCASGCSDEKARPTPEATPDAGVASVEIGVPSGPDGLDFEPLASDGELRLQTFGQGGTHVLLGVRCTGFGKRAFVGLTLENSNTGAAVVSPAPVRPQLLYCDAQMLCDLVPILAMASGLSEPGEERNGLKILIRAHVRNEEGVEAEAEQTASLSTADL